MSSQRQFFSGDSLAQALNQAAQHFQMLPAEIHYKVVDKRHGFLKVRRKVVIEVDASDPGGQRAAGSPSAASRKGERQPKGAGRQAAPRPAGEPEPEPAADPEPEPEPEPEEEPQAREPQVAVTSESRSMLVADAFEVERSVEPAADQAEYDTVDLAEAPSPTKSHFPGAKGEEVKAAAEALTHILDLAALDLESEILQGDEGLQIELWGGDQDLLLRDRGRILLAIQHLLPRMIRGLIGRSVACKVDSDEFHMIREEQLRDMAQRAADEVRQHGRPKTLEPMSPDERRIVHLTLADYPGVETESHGSGLFKRVMVRTNRGGKPRKPGRYDKR